MNKFEQVSNDGHQMSLVRDWDWGEFVGGPMSNASVVVVTWLFPLWTE